MQIYELADKKQAIKCPNCGKTWGDLLSLISSGGQVKGLGLALKAECPNCGTRFAVNSAWRTSKIIDGANCDFDKE